jgi:eukaryotic-like serine/threonine-protein kinase
MDLIKNADFTGRLVDRYAIVALIRSGAQGSVYRGRDDLLRREVAVKVRPDAGLRAEARALSSLNHPNVAGVYDFVTEHAQDFMVMEFIAGATLAEVLAGGPLPPGEVVRLGLQLARGLAAIHSAHLAHCDIKPANLKITSYGSLKIVDFGVARRLPPGALNDSAPTTMTTVVGTFPYMAPEVLRGERPDARSDIFSAGAVLYEMASGCRAFPQQTLPALVRAIDEGEIVPPSRLNPVVPVALDDVVVRALEKHRERRYENGFELAQALDALAPRRRRPARDRRRTSVENATRPTQSAWP